MLVLAAKQAVAALEKRAAKDGADALQSRLATSVAAQRALCPEPLRKVGRAAKPFFSPPS